jgi:PAS domain-containing protein
MATDVALRESESRHRVLLEALPQLVWTGAGDGACDYFNPQGLHRPRKNIWGRNGSA